jgi:DNA-directed RNA polymerase specialized sigma24 family protein
VLHEIIESLSSEERLICFWTAFGFSKERIANVSGHSIDSVERIVERVRQTVHNGLHNANAESKK